MPALSSVTKKASHPMSSLAAQLLTHQPSPKPSPGCKALRAQAPSQVMHTLDDPRMITHQTSSGTTAIWRVRQETLYERSVWRRETTSI
jgi:hypothetical protein